MKKAILLLLISFLFLATNAQVAINASGNAPNSKAMLDVSSDTQGMLVPRMTSTQRNTFEATLSASEKGMLVFDTETNSFCYYNGTAFEQLSNGIIAALQDADGDTKVEVEKTADQDVIRFSTGGIEYFAMAQGHLSVQNTGGSVFIGQSAGATDDLTNNKNTGIGYWSLFYNTSGENNTAIGNNSLHNNLSGVSNVAIGTHTLYTNTTISGSVAIGDSALYWNGNGASYEYDAHFNTAVGNKAMLSNTIGRVNTATGFKTLYYNTSGNGNTANGARGLYRNTTGSRNTSIGATALYNNTIGTKNTASGYYALMHNTTGTGNTASGDNALERNESGNSNVAYGAYALYWNSTVGNLVAIGDSTLFHNGTGASGTLQAHFNTAVGSKALFENTTGYNNTANGFESLKSNIIGSFNTAHGCKALFSNTNGTNNTAIGEHALHDNQSGTHNTASGSSALYSNTGSSNTAQGSLALYSNLGGNNNTAQGVQALHLNSSGNDNTAIGYGTLLMNSSGDENTAVGYRALNSSTGNRNLAFGVNALYNSTGSNNIAIGYKAGDNIITGSDNIIIGYDIDANNSAISNSLNIGNLLFGTGIDGLGNLYSSGNIGIGTVSPAAKLDVRGSTMQIKNISGNVIFEIDGSSGNSEIQFEELGSYKGAIGYNMTSDYLYFYEGGNVVLRNGNFGIGTTSPGSRLQVGESGDGSWARANSWYTFSDKRLKKDIVVIDNPLYKLNQLSGYYYYWKDGKDNTRQLGIVAQEVEEVLPEIVATDDEGIKSVDYSKLTPLLIEALKEQQETIKKLEARIEALER